MTTPNAPAAPPVAVGQIMSAFMLSRVVHVALHLGVFDIVADGPKTSEEIATATKTHAPSVARLLRALAFAGLLEELEGERYAAAACNSELLTGPNTLRSFALLLGGDASWASWGALLHSVQTGESGHLHVYGENPFERRAKHPEDLTVFNEAMGWMTRNFAKAVLPQYDFSAYGTIVDVGGGNGTLLAAILGATPAARGVLFDLPSGVVEAKKTLDAAGVAGRYDIHEGSFFESVPSGGDLYILKSSIQDWNDERSVVILRNVRRAMAAHAKLLLVEPLRPATVAVANKRAAPYLMDLQMLVGPGGQFRSLQEFEALLAQSGLELAKQQPQQLVAGFSLIEAVPVQEASR
jgi:hypothetical protein